VATAAGPPAGGRGAFTGGAPSKNKQQRPLVAPDHLLSHSRLIPSLPTRTPSQVAAPEKEGLLSDLFRGDSANRAGTLATFQGVLSFEPCTAISNPEASCATPECLIPGAYNAAIGQAFCGVSEKATCQEQGAELVGCNCIVFGIGGLSRPSYWEVEINFAVIEQDLCGACSFWGGGYVGWGGGWGGGLGGLQRNRRGGGRE